MFVFGIRYLTEVLKRIGAVFRTIHFNILIFFEAR